MKYIFHLFVSVFALQLTVQADEPKQGGDASAALKCEIVEEGNKNIRCTYSCERVPFDRNITFSWRSSETPHDDRERTIILKENHGSLYDYRYYYGRAKGSWNITVTDDEGKTLADTSFVIE